jgi:site-specific DNA-cytosine methylase
MKKYIPKDSIFIDLAFKNFSYPNSNIYSPCIARNGSLWCVPINRYANIKELLTLQGFPKNFKQAVSNSQLKKQIGNSMSVCVVKEIFKNMFNL